MVIDSKLYKTHREKLAAKMEDGSMVVFFAGEEKLMCADDAYRFLPDRNFYYLTGLERPGFILVMEKKDGETSVNIFAPGRDKAKERWTGKRLDFEQVAEIAGVAVEDVKDIETFEVRSLEYINRNDYKVYVDGTSIMEAPRDFALRVKKAGLVTNDISQVMTELRLVKSPEEQSAISEAAAITEQALSEMRKLIKPGVTEYELYLKLENEMALRSNMLFAFQTIVACGNNAFYLHHGNPERDGDGIAREGSFIQVDVGARVCGLCADISRVYFVGRPQSADDKRVRLHALIKELRRAAFEFIAPGKTFGGLNSQMYDIAGRWLAEQGLIADNFTVDDVRSYYWHNTSHYLGLDVHDVGSRDLEFVPGNCLAVEPGVYIPEWGVGFRIEDDVVLTSDGCRLLSSGADELEDIIAD